VKRSPEIGATCMQKSHEASQRNTKQHNNNKMCENHVEGKNKQDDLTLTNDHKHLKCNNLFQAFTSSQKLLGGPTIRRRGAIAPKQAPGCVHSDQEAPSPLWNLASQALQVVCTHPHGVDAKGNQGISESHSSPRGCAFAKNARM
jgi:hypothetical protein